MAETPSPASGLETASEATAGRGGAVALVLGAVCSVQVGAGFAVTLFDRVGPAGAVLLRLSIAAAVLVVAWRPDVRRLGRRELWLVMAFGCSLGVMNWTFYEAIDRIPLGVAVTLEFVGPLGVAVVGSRNRLDLLWVAFSAVGIVLLANPGGAAAPYAFGVVLAPVV